MISTKYCPRCQATKPVGEFYRNKGRYDGVSPYCVVCQTAAGKASYDALRHRAVQHLGGRCQRCGYDADERALQFDHVHGTGRAERLAGIVMQKTLNAVLSDTVGKFQLLCARIATPSSGLSSLSMARGFTHAIPQRNV